jgi:hypothetical protein
MVNCLKMVNCLEMKNNCLELFFLSLLSLPVSLLVLMLLSLLQVTLLFFGICPREALHQAMFRIK